MFKNKNIGHDTEDRGWWHIHGESKERDFCNLCQKLIGLDVGINPDKEKNRTAPDIIVDGSIADLKTQNTPFFTADRYGIDPRFAVTFNRKDYERYKRLYPAIDIYFWVDWQQTEISIRGTRISVEYLFGIYTHSFAEIQEMIEKSRAPEHHYQRRRFDIAGNAKSSFILDVREFKELYSTNSTNEISERLSD